MHFFTLYENLYNQLIRQVQYKVRRHTVRNQTFIVNSEQPEDCTLSCSECAHEEEHYVIQGAGSGDGNSEWETTSEGSEENDDEWQDDILEDMLSDDGDSEWETDDEATIQDLTDKDRERLNKLNFLEEKNI